MLRIKPPYMAPSKLVRSKIPIFVIGQLCLGQCHSFINKYVVDLGSATENDFLLVDLARII